MGGCGGGRPKGAGVDLGEGKFVCVKVKVKVMLDFFVCVGKANEKRCVMLWMLFAIAS